MFSAMEILICTVLYTIILLNEGRTRNWHVRSTNQTPCRVFCRRKDKVIAVLNLLKLTGYVMHQQFNIQQPYVLPTL